jgi:hypothetical protein
MQKDAQFLGALACGKNNKLSHQLYGLLCQSKLPMHLPWPGHIQQQLNDLGMKNMWREHSIPSHGWLKAAVTLRISDCFLQNWNEGIFRSEKCITYRMFKQSCKLEPYLINLPQKYATILCKFRVSNHR